MAQQELTLDYDYYENNQCSFEDLKEASHQLTSATEEQFEQIKKEKWFTRVFDMVTFSKKNEKRMAGQIANLAQAQQMMMEILVRLSGRDARISNLVEEAFEKIEKLAKNDVLLAKRINLLENRCILGISKETDIDDLTEIDREILGGLFYYLMHQFEQASENQRRYANQVLNYLEAGAQEIDIHASLASINQIEIKKKLLTCCLEYCFLNDNHFDLPEGAENLVDEFDFGNKTIREVKNKITALYKLRGADGFIDKYGHYDEIEEAFYVELPEMDLEEDPVELEEIHINRILHIPSTEEKIFNNKIVHISAYINCEGHLEFHNCIVYYSETKESDEITLSEGASITFSNCEVNCLSTDKNPFIQAKGKNEISLINCELNDCSHFLSMNIDSRLDIMNCVIHSPGEDFIKADGWRDDELPIGQMTNTHFFFDSPNKVGKDGFLKETIIHMDGAVHINNCIVRGMEPFVPENMKLILFDITKGEYQNCSFININECIKNGTAISECSFEGCKQILVGTSFLSKLDITNCLFKECEEIFYGENITVKNCQFISCKNQIVNGEGITVEFCEFYNHVHDLTGLVIDASFQFRCGKNSSPNKISKCLFDGVEIGDGFLVQGSTYEKIAGPKVYVEDCDFRNCTTKRETNVIVRQYNHFYGLFDRKIETKPVSITNCRGLDRVNMGQGKTEEVIIRSETPTGVKIGVAVAGAFGGLPGLAVGLGVAKLLKDDDLRKE